MPQTASLSLEPELSFCAHPTTRRETPDGARRFCTHYPDKEKRSSRLLQYRPEQIIDGAAAYWLGGIYALLGDRQSALEWLKRPSHRRCELPLVRARQELRQPASRPGVPDGNWSAATLISV
jgi:hypothetical protein